MEKIIGEGLTTEIPTDTKGSSASNGLFHLIVGVALPGIVCVLGLLGNTVTLIVLRRVKYNVLFHTLRALASADAVLLLCALLQQIIPMACQLSRDTGWFCTAIGYLRVYSWPLICMAQMVSVWVTVLLSLERFVAIVTPLKSMHTCTVRRVKIAVATLWVLAIVFNIPKFFEYKPEIRSIDNATIVHYAYSTLRESPVYRYLYNTVMYGLLLYAIPLCLLSFLTLKTVQELHRARRNWNILNRAQQHEHKATVVPLLIVTVFFICGTQAFLAFILDAIYNIPGSVAPIWLDNYTAVVNLLVIVNSACNVILMYAFGSKFRRLVSETFPCCFTPASRQNSIERTEAQAVAL